MKEAKGIETGGLRQSTAMCWRQRHKIIAETKWNTKTLLGHRILLRLKNTSLLHHSGGMWAHEEL
jgi:hypothetical protein